MSNAKYTPGPWRMKPSESKEAFNVVGTVLGRKYKVARCPFTVTGIPEVDEKEKAEAKANANLIAAAPDMLSLLAKIKNLLLEPRDIQENQFAKIFWEIGHIVSAHESLQTT